MSKDIILDCKPSFERLAPLRECTNNYEVGDASEDWPWNVLSTGTIAFTCGALYLPGTPPIAHQHSAAELEWCRQTAAEAASTMDGVAVGMGSESMDSFAPFFITANNAVEQIRNIDETTLRSAFGGTICPNAQIVFEPLSNDTHWWSKVKTDCDSNPKTLSRWEGMMTWFHANANLNQPQFVAIGDRNDTDIRGCVFPRLILGVTSTGSLVGMAGFVVHS